MLIEAVTDTDIWNSLVNLGSGTQWSIMEVINLGSEPLQVDAIILFEELQPGGGSWFQADMARCRKIFNEVRRTSLREGLALTISWLKQSWWK